MADYNPDSENENAYVDSHFQDYQFEIENHLFPDVSHFFVTDAKFENRETAEEWVRASGRREEMFFYVKRVKPKFDGTSKVWLGCEKGGKPRYDGKKAIKDVKKKGSKKVECKFEVYLVEIKDDGWRVQVSEFNNAHNHPLTTNEKWHTSASKLTKTEIERVDQLYSANVKPKQILNILKMENPDNRSSRKHVENALVSIRKKKMGSLSKMDYFFTLMKRHGYMHWSRQSKHTNVLTDVMFAHPKTMDMLVLFPYVLLMDATYKTNKYDMPLLEIIGITPVGKNYHVAFAFLSNEKTQTFNWALRELRSYLVRLPQPDVIVTDRELALMNAIRDNFPGCQHMLCKRHIAKDVEKYVRNLTGKRSVAAIFMKRWTDIAESKTEEDYWKCCAVMEDKWKRVPAVVRYVNSTWLEPYKDRFVFAWTKQYMHFGNRTTNRVESAHSQLKRWLYTCAGGFDHIFEQIHSAVDLQFNEILTLFESSLNVANPHTYTNYLLRRLRFKVSSHAINLLQEEWNSKQGIKEPVNGDSERCGCLFRLSYGLPCACEMWKLSQENIPIELHNIHVFWRTLSMDGAQAMISSTRESASDLMKSIFLDTSRDPEPQQYHYAKKYFDYVTVQRNVPEPQTVQRKGRPKNNPTKRDPSGYEYADRQPERESKDRGRGRGRGRSSSGSTGNSLLYASELPRYMFPYISSVVDVDPDGNCGFRVIAHFIYQDKERWDQVRLDLMQEITEYSDFYRGINLLNEDMPAAYINLNFHRSPAPQSHWLNLGILGYVIVTRYQRIVTCLCNITMGCVTWLPLQARSDDGQPPLPPTTSIDIGWVHENHFIVLKMKPSSPLPRLPLQPTWEGSCDPAIRHWLPIWNDRLTSYLNIET